MDAIEKTAGHLKNLTQSLYVPRHEYRQVDARTFRHLDLDFYDRIRDTLVSRGCVWLGDVENVTMKGKGIDFRTFIRVLVSEDRATSIGVYHPKPRFWIAMLLWVFRVKLGRLIDCESELSTGEYFITSNATQASKLNPPPGFNIKFFALNTGHEAVFEAHRRRLRDFMTANPGIRATAMRNSEDVLEMQHRMQAVKAAHRKGLGYLTQDELTRLGADSDTAARIKQAMSRPEA